MAINGINLRPLDQRTGEWVSLFEAALYLEKDPNVLKLETKKPLGDGTNGTTPLQWRREKGKHHEFTAESLIAYANVARKRGGFGRAPSTEGKIWHTSRINPAIVEEIKALLASKGVELIDPAVKVKENKARKAAESEKQAA